MFHFIFYVQRHKRFIYKKRLARIGEKLELMAGIQEKPAESLEMEGMKYM